MIEETRIRHRDGIPVAQLVGHGDEEVGPCQNKPRAVYVLAVTHLLMASFGIYIYGRLVIDCVSTWWRGESITLDAEVAISTVGALLCAVFLIIGSMGLFLFSPIGRKSSMFYVVISLATTLFYLALMVFDLTRKIDGVIDADEGGVVIFGGALILLRLVYPLITFLFLRNKAIASSFDSQ